MIGQFLADLKNSLAPDRLLRVLRGPAWALVVIGTVCNGISIFTSLFALLAYDKVFPHNGTSTLIVLTVGVLALVAIDVALRMLRTALINHALFGIASTPPLSVLRDRFRVPGSRATGRVAKTYLEQAIDDLSKVQATDVKTATLAVDLPFAILLLVAIFLIAGPLVYVPLVALIALLGLVAATHKNFKAASGNLDTERRRAIEAFAFLSRGSDWLFGLGAWRWLIGKESAARQQIADSSAKVAHYANLRQVGYQTISQIVSIATIFFGFFLYQAGDVTLGAIIATYMLTTRVLAPVGSIAQMSQVTEPKEKAEVSEPMGAQSPLIDIGSTRSEWRIDFVKVGFTYEGKTSPALVVENLSVKAGERIAVVGRSGSGKTTLARILCRALDGVDGALMWNQLPISSINEDSWERFCVYIPQTPWLGQGSLFDQIRLGDSSISDADIAQAIGSAGLQNLFVADQKTISGEGFSAGQVQLLGLIRCLTRNASLLVLDEPTNFLDEETEQKVMRAIMTRYAAATVILITHRKSLLSLMDRVLVVETGRIVRDAQIKKVA